jgi:hypothetical protein
MPDPPHWPAHATSDAEGAFELRGVEEGDWAVSCSADGACGVPQGVVRLPDVRRFDVTLPPGAVIEGTLVDDVTGAPLTSANVRATVRALRSGVVLAEADVGADGRFAFDLHRRRAEIDEYRVEAYGYARHPKEWEPGCDADVRSAGERVQLAFRAVRGAVVKGVVRGPSGPLDGVEITAWFSVPAPGESGSTTVSWTTKSNFGGAYEIVGVEGSECVIRATASGLVQTEATDAALRDPRAWPDAAPDACKVEIPDENRATAVVAHDVTLVTATPLPRRALHGVVHDSVGKPIAGATVRAGRSFDFVETTSGADGTFAVDAPVVEDIVLVSTWRTGYEEFSTTVGGSPPLEIELTAAPALRGRVVDAKGAPVAGARVVATSILRTDAPDSASPPFPATAPIETSGDVDGRFSVRFRGGPTVDAVVISAPGFATQRVVLSDDASEETSIVLAALHELTGRVVRSDTGAPVGGVRIAELPPDVDDPKDDDVVRLGRVLAVTAADGSFRIAAIGAGPRRLAAFGAALLPRPLVVEVPHVESVRLDVDPSLAIAGRLTFEDGAPAPEVDVTAFAHPRGADKIWPEQAAPSVTTRADGRFVVSNLRPGKHWISVGGGDPRIIEASIGPLTPDAGVEQTIRVVRGATIVGRLVDVAGRPVVAVDGTCEPKIRATPSDGDDRPDGRGWVKSGDKTGAFAVGGLDHGAYDLVVHARGFVPLKISNVRADAGPLVVKLDRGLSLSGVVFGVDGRPLAHATIVATPEDPAAEDEEARRNCDTDAGGRFRIAGLTQGRWRLDLFNGVTFDHKQRLDGENEFDAGADDVRLRCVAVEPKRK